MTPSWRLLTEPYTQYTLYQYGGMLAMRDRKKVDAIAKPFSRNSLDRRG